MAADEFRTSYVKLAQLLYAKFQASFSTTLGIF